MTTLTISCSWTNLSDDALLEKLSAARREITGWQVTLGRCEQEVYRRLEERRARAIPSNKYICELIPENTYVQELFGPLKEVLVQADLVEVLTPAHHETVNVPDKWATQKVLALARQLPEVQAVVDKARVVGRARLRFEKRR